MILLAALACVPLPFLTPPATLDAGVGAATAPSDKGAVTSYPRIVASLRPLGLVTPLQDRKLDPHTGVLIEFQGDGSPALAGTTGVDYRAWRTPLGPRWHSIAGPTFAVDVLVDPLREGVRLSPGARVGLRWELVSWMHYAGASASGYNPGAGVAHGEGGLGAYLDAGARVHPDGARWQISAGVTVRTPASAGLVLVPGR